eukprot:scaffold1046_cov162-Ochromonas_danica.AAC.41
MEVFVRGACMARQGEAIERGEGLIDTGESALTVSCKLPIKMKYNHRPSSSAAMQHQHPSKQHFTLESLLTIDSDVVAIPITCEASIIRQNQARPARDSVFISRTDGHLRSHRLCLDCDRGLPIICFVVHTPSPLVQQMGMEEVDPAREGRKQAFAETSLFWCERPGLEEEMVVKTELCAFSEYRIYPGHGQRFIRKDGQPVTLSTSKCKRLLLNRKKPAKLMWTQAWRRLNKKGKDEGIVRKK